MTTNSNRHPHVIIAVLAGDVITILLVLLLLSSLPSSLEEVNQNTDKREESKKRVTDDTFSPSPPHTPSVLAVGDQRLGHRYRQVQSRDAIAAERFFIRTTQVAD